MYRKLKTSVAELREMLVGLDDDTDHVIWVDRSGHVHVHEGRWSEVAILRGYQLHLETRTAGSGLAGEQVVEDECYVPATYLRLCVEFERGSEGLISARARVGNFFSASKQDVEGSYLEHRSSGEHGEGRRPLSKHPSVLSTNSADSSVAGRRWGATAKTVGCVDLFGGAGC